MLAPSELTRLANLMRGLPILGCQPGSVAAVAGVRYGDILLSMNGVSVPSWSELFALRKRLRGSIWVRVLRGSKQLVLPFDLPATAQSPRDVLGALSEPGTQCDAKQLGAASEAEYFS